MFNSLWRANQDLLISQRGTQHARVSGKAQGRAMLLFYVAVGIGIG